MKNLTEKMAERGHEVHVFCGSKEENMGIYKVNGVVYHVYLNPWEKLPIVLRNIVYILFSWIRMFSWRKKLEGFDIVDCYRKLIGADVTTFTGLPMYNFKNANWKKKLIVIPLIILNKVFLKLHDGAMITTYYSRAERIKRYHGVEPDAVVRCAVNEEFFDIEKKSGGCFQVLSLKRPKKVMKIAREIDRDDIEFIVIDPSGRESINLENVRVYGRLPHDRVVEFLGEANVFLNLSGIPSLANREAMASGTCVVTAEPTLIEDGFNGFKVGGWKEAMEKISYLADNRDTCWEVGEKGREAVEDLRWDYAVGKTLRVYRGLSNDS